MATIWFRLNPADISMEVAAAGRNVLITVDVSCCLWNVWINGRLKERGYSTTPQGAKVQASRAATDYIRDMKGSLDADQTCRHCSTRVEVSQ